MNSPLEGAGRVAVEEGRRNTAEAGRAPGRDHEHGRFAAHHGRAGEQRIEGFRRRRGIAWASALFGRERLAGHQRFVEVGDPAVEHDPIGGHQIARFELDDVARYHLFDRDRNDLAVAANVCVDGDGALQRVGRFFRAVLLHHIQYDRQCYDDDNDAEAGDIACKARYGGRHNQDCDERLGKSLGDFQEQPPVRRSRYGIRSEAREPLSGFDRGQPGGAAFDLVAERLERQAPELIGRRDSHVRWRLGRNDATGITQGFRESRRYRANVRLVFAIRCMFSRFFTSRLLDISAGAFSDKRARKCSCALEPCLSRCRAVRQIVRCAHETPRR